MAVHHSRFSQAELPESVVRLIGRFFFGACGLVGVVAAWVPGATCAEVFALAERELRRARAVWALLGYARGGAPPYPAVLCTWVNAVVVHGFPV